MLKNIILILLIYNTNKVLSEIEHEQKKFSDKAEKYSTKINIINLSLEYFSHKKINVFAMAICTNEKGKQI